MTPTYDEIQLGAVLTCCAVCHGYWYATKPTDPWVCRDCRRKPLKGGLRGDPVGGIGQGDD